MSRTKNAWARWTVGVCLLSLAATTVGLVASPSGVRPEWKIRFAWVGQILRAAGFEPHRADMRYDFQFTQFYNNRPWQFTMSALLSQDGQTLWLIAWLAQLPPDENEVSTSTLLQLLALNDRLGNNTFFAYLPSSQRLVLERPVSLLSGQLDGKTLRKAILELSRTVADTYSTWSSIRGAQLAANAHSAAGLTADDQQPSPRGSQSSGAGAAAHLRLLPGSADEAANKVHRPLVRMQWLPAEDH